MNGERLYCYGRIEQKCNHVMHMFCDMAQKERIGMRKSDNASLRSDFKGVY